MNLRRARTMPLRKYLTPLLVLTFLVVSALGYAATSLMRERRQAEVAGRGAQIMPFDLDQTTHYFEPTASGGVQTVTANDQADQEQVRLIRHHLQAEAGRFRQGDFSDPAAIHGQTMPGLAALRAGAGHLQVAYSPVSAGAQLTYTASDPALIQALHLWFDAQLSDHGAHAKPGMEH